MKWADYKNQKNAKTGSMYRDAQCFELSINGLVFEAQSLMRLYTTLFSHMATDNISQMVMK